ncbi:hypothetical protein [Marinobacterium sp. BA1]|uniref:hypothetical protein n=1 Tax=Marinobacterium sp. BA1 TaxID=3138931 RepID=UPI0032E786DE
MINVPQNPVSAAEIRAYREQHGCGLYEAKSILEAEYRARVKAAIRQAVQEAETMGELKEAITAWLDHC